MSEAIEKTKIKAVRPKCQQKKQLILAAAQQLFLRKGVETVSMDMIAKEAGVAKQTVYSHFQNKETLYSDAISGIYAMSSMKT